MRITELRIGVFVEMVSIGTRKLKLIDANIIMWDIEALYTHEAQTQVLPDSCRAASVINAEAAVGITGQNSESITMQYDEIMSGQAPAEVMDKENIACFSLDPDSLTDQVVYTANQPWVVSIAEVTVRAAGEGFAFFFGITAMFQPTLQIMLLV